MVASEEGVVESCRLPLPGVQAAVMVTLQDVGVPEIVLVEVTSRMGTKLEQKAEALNATSTARQAPTLSRVSISARSTAKAEIEAE